MCAAAGAVVIKDNTADRADMLRILATLPAKRRTASKPSDWHSSKRIAASGPM
jgi:hypothetical protein